MASNTAQFGNGTVARLLRERDWADSPLGSPEDWPQSLRAIITLMLHSKFPMFVAWGPQLALIYNDAYVDMLANKHPAALGQPFSEVWGEIWPDISPIVELALAGESSFFENLPLTMHRKGFEERAWFTFSYSPVHDEHGQIAGMYCAGSETTQQVLTEQNRISENERLRNLFQQAPGVMAVLRGRDFVFELVNDAYSQLVGFRELIGRPVREALPEVDGQGIFELLDEVYATGEPYVGRGTRVKLQRRPGSVLEERFVDFIFQPIRNTDGEVSGIFVEGSDVTDAVKAHQALRESEQRLMQLANTIPHMAWMADAEGAIHWFNDRWYDYTGSSFEQVKGWGWQSVHSPETLPTVMAEYKACLASGTPFEMSFPLRSRNGEFRTFFTMAAPLRDFSGTIVQWFGTNTDIHEMVMAQEELRATSERKDEFLAMLAHELRNPLAPLNTAAELFKRANLDPEMIRATSGIVTRQVAHMTDLLDDLLDVSRVTRGIVTLQEDPIDLKDVITDALEQVGPLITVKEQKVAQALQSEPVIVLGDRTRLTQIVSNLLNNASKYTPFRGRITVSLEVEEHHASIRVTDNGVGIEEKLLPSIFELFTQAERSPDRAQGGLGLGLALVKSLVALHHGSVSAKSAGLNQGSEFLVRLPRLLNSAPSSLASGDTCEVRQLQPGSVMIIDDNEDAARTLGMLLDLHGYKTLLGFSSAEALQHLSRDAPGVMILDIGLPDMDGCELARRIRTMPTVADAVLVALTGYGQDRDREQSKEAGFDYHLVKPVDIQELLDVLADAGSKNVDG